MRASIFTLARTFTRKLVPRAPSTLPTVQQGQNTAPTGLPGQNTPPAVPGPPQGGGGLMDIVKEGFAFGVGSAIARTMVGGLFDSVGGMMGAGSPPPPPAESFQHDYKKDDEQQEEGGDDEEF